MVTLQGNEDARFRSRLQGGRDDKSRTEKKLFGIWISCPAYLSGSFLQEQQTRNSITIKIL
jgi:hypothetical protein